MFVNRRGPCAVISLQIFCPWKDLRNWSSIRVQTSQKLKYGVSLAGIIWGMVCRTGSKNGRRVLFHFLRELCMCACVCAGQGIVPKSVTRVTRIDVSGVMESCPGIHYHFSQLDEFLLPVVSTLPVLTCFWPERGYPSEWTVIFPETEVFCF